MIPWTIAHQAPLSVGFSRQEYQSGLPFPTRGDLPDPGIEPTSLLSTCIGRWALLPLTPPGKSHPSLCRWVKRSLKEIQLTLCSHPFLPGRLLASSCGDKPSPEFQELQSQESFPSAALGFFGPHMKMLTTCQAWGTHGRGHRTSRWRFHCMKS